MANELGKTWKANAGGNLSGSATSTQVMPGDEVQFVVLFASDEPKRTRPLMVNPPLRWTGTAAAVTDY